jgi:hypothetical protein
MNNPHISKESNKQNQNKIAFSILYDNRDPRDRQPTIGGNVVDIAPRVGVNGRPIPRIWYGRLKILHDGLADLCLKYRIWVGGGKTMQTQGWHGGHCNWMGDLPAPQLNLDEMQGGDTDAYQEFDPSAILGHGGWKNGIESPGGVRIVVDNREGNDLALYLTVDHYRLNVEGKIGKKGAKDEQIHNPWFFVDTWPQREDLYLPP